MTNDKTNEMSNYQTSLISFLDERIVQEKKVAEVKTNSKTAEKFEKLRNRLLACADTLEMCNVQADFIKRVAIYVADKIVATTECVKHSRKITDHHVIALLKNAQAMKDDAIEFDYNLLRAMCSKNCDHAYAKKLKYRNASYDAATASTQSSYAKTTLVELRVCKEDRTTDLSARNASKNKIVFDYESETLAKLFALI